MSQSVRNRTLDFGLGNDLTVCQMEPCFGLCTDGTEPTWESFSISLSAPLPPLKISK